MFRGRRRGGQVMILTILALGGTILGATTIAGLLLNYQIRQSTDANSSARAIFAADAGIEYALYQYFVNAAAPKPSFANGSDFQATCYAADGSPLACGDAGVRQIRSRGFSRNIHRAFYLEFGD